MAERRYMKTILLLLILLLTPSQVLAAPVADITHYSIKLLVMPQDEVVFGTTSIMMNSSELDRLTLNLDENLTVQSARLGKEELGFQRDGKKINLAFKRPLYGANEITLRYAGFLEEDVEDHSWAHIGEDGAYAVYEANWYPNMPNDRATAEIILQAPLGWKGVSNGALTEYTSEENIFYWNVASPEIGFSFSSGRYLEITDYEKHRPLSCYLLSPKAGCALTLKDATTFFSSNLTPYSYPKLALTEVKGRLNGGHGDHSLILMSSDILSKPAYEEFLAHEVAHSWFGGMVTAKDSKWLTEGFATYAGVMYLESLNPSLAKEALESKRSEYLRIKDLGIDKTILSAEMEYDEVFHATVYSKGAYVLHMLRYVIGAEAFSKTLKDYLERYNGGSASVAEFQKIAEEVSGDELGWFFDEWLGSTVIPDFYIQSASLRNESGTYHVNATLSQSGDVVQMPVDVSLLSTSENLTQRVWIDSRSTEVTFQTISQPIFLEIDTNGWILESDRLNNRFILRYPFNTFGLRLFISSIARRFQTAF
jgi:aminopeptidase N